MLALERGTVCLTLFLISHFFLDSRIWESPLLQAAKENNLAAIRKLLTDGTCDIYQRGNWDYLRKMVFFGRLELPSVSSLLVC